MTHDLLDGRQRDIGLGKQGRRRSPKRMKISLSPKFVKNRNTRFIHVGVKHFRAMPPPHSRKCRGIRLEVPQAVSQAACRFRKQRKHRITCVFGNACPDGYRIFRKVKIPLHQAA
ncbi:MAG: hypothetical protein FWG74_07740 [Planctomycetes bacterium]|nr:hypothetical protein [Planctomycetota bacterium]